jgi:polysaccharide biosynthesis transport protein
MPDSPLSHPPAPRAPLMPAAVSGEEHALGREVFFNSAGTPVTPVQRVTVERLLAHRWLALTLFLAVSVPATVAVWFLYLPTYEARAGLYVAPTKPKIAYKTEDDRGNFHQQLNDQAVNLQSTEVLNRVLDNKEIQQTAWYGEAPALALFGTPTRLERLRKDLKVSTARDSSFVWVTMTSEKAADATLIANAVIDECVAFVTNDYGSDDEKIYNVQISKRDGLDSEVKGIRRDIERLLVNSGLYTDDPESLVQQRVAALDNKEEQLQQLQGQLKLARGERGRRTTDEPAPQTTAEAASQPATALRAADPEWRRLQEASLNADYAVQIAAQHFGTDHPEMARLRESARLTRDRLQAYETEMDQRPAAPATPAATAQTPTMLEFMSGPALDAYIKNLEQQEQRLGEEIAKQRGELERVRSQIEQLAQKQDELRRKTEDFEAWRKAALARTTEREAPPWTKKRYAVAPTEPVNAKRRYMLLAMSAFGGLALGLAAAYWRASTSQSILGANDIVTPAEMPFLGYIPQLRDPQVLSPEEQALRTESARMIRTALLERMAGTHGSVIMVTSAGAGTGKTTIARLLAESLANCGKRVLLIDADLRNATLSKRCAADGKPGLTDVLHRNATDAQAIIGLDGTACDVLPAGAPANLQDCELMANGALSAGVARWRQNYNVIVFDSPPVVPVADARILTRQVDGTILVVRERHCRRDEVIEALAAISAAGGRMLGTIVIGQPRGHSYASYYSRYYTPSPASDGSPGTGAG